MYCSKCGKEIHNDAKFCIYCGNKIKKDTPDHSKYERFDYAPVVLRAEQGDEEAFTTLWAKTNQPYRYYIYLQSKNKDAVDDILQESYRRIFKDIMEKKLQNPEAFFSWGKRIVLNTTADHYRKYKYETQEEKVSESTADENDVKDFYKEDYATDFNPEAQITQNEVSDILQDIIGELPESQKNCILLWMDEYKTDEIAEILGMSSGTVKSNVNYAKKKIKTKVEDLEKQGVKLYSMAPFTFFVWLMAQFDQNAASAAPSTGNTVLFEQIIKQVHMIANAASGESISGQVGNKLNETTSQSLEDAKQAVPQNSGQTASSTSDIGTQPAGQMQDNSVNSKAFPHAGNESNTAQNAAGNTVKKSFISTVVGKVVFGIASVAIIAVCILGVFYYHHMKGEPAPDKTQNNNANATSIRPDSLPTSSKDLAEIIGKEYIGDQLYYYEDEPSVKTGCIETAVLDMDKDGQYEIVSIENDDTGFGASPVLRVYEYANNCWKVSAEQQITINTGLEKTPENACSCSLYLYVMDEQIAVRISGSQTANSPVEIYSYSNTGTITVSEGNGMTEFNLHEEGKVFCEIYYQYMSKDIYTYWGMDRTSVENDSYIVNFVNWKDPKKYETADYAFSYPRYYDNYLDIKTTDTDTIGYTKQVHNDEDMGDFNGKPYSIFSFVKGNEFLEAYEDWGYGFPQYDLSSLLWQDGKDYIIFDQGGDSIACIALLTEQNDYDIKAFNIYWMILMDMNELCYHFETTLPGTATINANNYYN